VNDANLAYHLVLVEIIAPARTKQHTSASVFPSKIRENVSAANQQGYVCCVRDLISHWRYEYRKNETTCKQLCTVKRGAMPSTVNAGSWFRVDGK